MHVVVRPPLPDKNSGNPHLLICRVFLYIFLDCKKNIVDFSSNCPQLSLFIDLENCTAADKLQDNSQKKGGCFCAIL